MTRQHSSIDEPTAEIEDATAPEAFRQDRGIGLIGLCTELAYRKDLIAKVTGAGLLVGLVLSLLLPVEYTATTRIMPPQQTQSTAAILMNQLTGLSSGPLAAMAGAGLGLKNPNDIYIGLLSSRPVADSIIQRFELARAYHASDMTEARKSLAARTQIASEKNGFIAVSVTDRDRNRAAAIANAYNDELKILTKSLAVTEASQRRLFYEDQLKQTREALTAAELDFQKVQQQHGLIQLEGQARALIEGLAEMRAQVAAKQVQVQALRSFSTEKNPSVQLAERELASLRSEEARIEQRNGTPGIAGLGLGNVPAAGLEYLRAQHELLYQQALYDMLMKQFEAARLDESKDAVIIQVVEPAIAPDQKSAPRRALILVLSTFAGFFAGCFLALLMGWQKLLELDPNSVRQIQELRFALSSRRAARA